MHVKFKQKKNSKQSIKHIFVDSCRAFAPYEIKKTLLTLNSNIHSFKINNYFSKDRLII